MQWSIIENHFSTANIGASGSDANEVIDDDAKAPRDSDRSYPTLSKKKKVVEITDMALESSWNEILSFFIDHIQELKSVDGIQAIPYLQVSRWLRISRNKFWTIHFELYGIITCYHSSACNDTCHALFWYRTCLCTQVLLMLCSSLTDSENDQQDLERVVNACLDVLNVSLKVSLVYCCLFILHSLIHTYL